MRRMSIKQMLHSPAAQSCLQTFFSPTQVTAAIIQYTFRHGDTMLTGERLCELILDSELSSNNNTTSSGNNNTSFNNINTNFNNTGIHNNSSRYKCGNKSKSDGNNLSDKSDMPSTNKHKIQHKPVKADEDHSGQCREDLDTDDCWMCIDLLESVTQWSWSHMINCRECSTELYGTRYTNNASS